MANCMKMMLLGTTLLISLYLMDKPIFSDAQFVDGYTSGSILNNLWGRKRRSVAVADDEPVEEALPAVMRAKRQFAFVDGTASGTILQHLWNKKRRSTETVPKETASQMGKPETEGMPTNEQPPATMIRAKRQFYADGLTSGTILRNGWWLRKRRWADGLTSGTILNNLWGRKKRFVDGWTSGTILANLY